MSDQTMTQPQHTYSHLEKAQGYYNNNFEWVFPSGKKDSAVHWDNSVQRPAGQNLNHPNYGDNPAWFSGNNDPCSRTAHINVVSSDNLNNIHNLPHQENTNTALPKNCSQLSRATGHTNFGTSVSHVAERCYLSSENHMSGLKLPSQPTQNIQSTFENVSRIYESVSHKKTKRFFVTVSKDNTGLGFVAENVVLAEDQLLRADNSNRGTLDNSIQGFNGQFGKSSLVPCSISAKAHQQDTFLPKENHHEKNVHRKAVAVVTPLAQHVMGCSKFTKSSTKTNEAGLESRPVPDEQPHHCCPTGLLQSKTNDKESLCRNAAPTHHASQEMPSELATDTVFSQCSEPQDPPTAKELSNRSGNLNSIPRGSICKDKKESVQPSHIEERRSADATAINKSYTGTEQTNRCFSLPIRKWSLQELQALVTGSEQMQKRSQKEIPFADLSSEIMKLYWSGDYVKFCEAARSDSYINIMKEVQLHCGTKDSVILQELPKEKLDQLAEHFHILTHDPLPKVIRPSFFNLNDIVDSDGEPGHSFSLMTFHSAPKVADAEVMERKKKMQVAENEKIKASHEVLSTTVSLLQEQTQLSPTVHEKKCRGVEVLIENNEPVITVFKNTSFIRETSRQEVCLSKPSPVTAHNCKHVTVHDYSVVELFKTRHGNPSPQNEESLLVSLNKQLPAVNDDYIHVKLKDLLKATDTTPPLDDCGNPPDPLDPLDFIELIVLSPETAKQLAARESNKEVQRMQTVVSVQTFNDTVIEKTDQATTQLCDWMSEDKEEMDASGSLGEKNNQNTITGELQKYCCLAKWFHVLGYVTDVVCKCEKKTELSFGNDVSSTEMMEMSMAGKNVPLSPIPSDTSMDMFDMDVISDFKDVLKIANPISEQLADKPLAECKPDAIKKKDKYYRYATYQKERTRHPHCGAPRADLIPSLNNDPPQMDLILPSRRWTTGDANLQCNEKGKRTTNPEFQKEGRIVNLALYGSSDMRLKRSITAKNSAAKRIRSSNKGNFPPASINITVSPHLNNAPDSHKSQTTKQCILKSWRNSFASIKMFTDSRPKKLNRARGTESNMDAKRPCGIQTGACSTAFSAMRAFLTHQDDVQTHRSKSAGDKTVCSANQLKNPTGRSKDKCPSARRNKTKKQARRTTLASTNINAGQKMYKNKSSKSPQELPHTSRKSKLKSQRDLTLDFKVLPESFNFADGSTMMKDGQFASTDCEMPGRNVKIEKLKKRTAGNQGVWCFSPRREGHLKSALAANTSVSSSTFQEFKRRYKEKNRDCP